MGLVQRLVEKYVARLDELIAASSSIPIKQHTQLRSSNYLTGETRYRHYNLADQSEFVEWRTSCVAVLDQVIPAGSLLRQNLSRLNSLQREPTKIEYLAGFLRGVRAELLAGSLDSLARTIEAEVQSDYLDQASVLLAGGRDEQNHISAAVIAGASLERCLRTMCSALEPPEPVHSPKGAPLAMMALIDALKNRAAFNEVQAKELRAWAGVRNSAAHGQFSEFTRAQVESMVSGVLRFVTDAMR